MGTQTAQKIRMQIVLDQRPLDAWLETDRADCAKRRGNPCFSPSQGAAGRMMAPSLSPFSPFSTGDTETTGGTDLKASLATSPSGD